MKRALVLTIFFALGLVLPVAAHADLRVVTTTADLASIVRDVGGQHVDVDALALPTQDPHFVDARPHLALALARADLLVAVGLQLETGWLPVLQTGARNGDIQTGGRGYVEVATMVNLLEVPRQRVDRSMGDVHPGGNPHFLFDPRRAKVVALGLSRKMGELDPDHADEYAANATAFVRRLESARARWERRLAWLRGAKVVTYHRSFAYLADWLGFEVVERLEPRPGIPPNPRHVATVLSRARQEGVRVVLQETYYPTSTSRLVAERAGAELVVIPGGPDFRGGESYVDFVDAIGAALARAEAR